MLRYSGMDMILVVYSLWLTLFTTKYKDNIRKMSIILTKFYK